ncbi:MAG: DoxX protein [Marinirhabdus sp.]
MNATFTTILRIALGLGLLVFGLNKFVGVFPMFEMPAPAANFIESLKQSGYVYYVIAMLEIFIGALLLLRTWVPFALVLLVPISTNILLFHLFLDVSDILVAIVVFVINIILIYKYWKAYRPLFQ